MKDTIIQIVLFALSALFYRAIEGSSLSVIWIGLIGLCAAFAIGSAFVLSSAHQGSNIMGSLGSAAFVAINRMLSVLTALVFVLGVSFVL